MDVFYHPETYLKDIKHDTNSYHICKLMLSMPPADLKYMQLTSKHDKRFSFRINNWRFQACQLTVKSNSISLLI